MVVVIFFFNDTATTEIYTLSLHDALPICPDLGGLAQHQREEVRQAARGRHAHVGLLRIGTQPGQRSEEHTSELQSPDHLVCRLLLEKKNKHRPLLLNSSKPSVSASNSDIC